ncbi:MAG: uroporphyrinogen-III synthase [Bryobacteraceae bacterium]
MSFAHASVLSFESRRAAEMAELIRLNGGEPFVAPALIEVPLEQNQAALDFASRLYAGEFDAVVFQTGTGARLLQRSIAARDPEERFFEALRRVTTVCRGPKPAAVLRAWKVPVSVLVPEPATWREVLAAMETRPEKSLALQEYGRANRELIEGFTRQGKTVSSIPVYRWKLPEDTSLLARALDDLLAGKFQVTLFTTGVQIEHFLEFAAGRGQRERALAAFNSMFVASIGPDCSQSLRASGVAPAYEPSHPKMGILVREAALKFSERNRTA